MFLLNIFTASITYYVTVLPTLGGLRGDVGVDVGGGVGGRFDIDHCKRMIVDSQKCPPCQQCPLCPDVDVNVDVDVEAKAKAKAKTDIENYPVDFKGTSWKASSTIPLTSVLDGSYGFDLGVPPLKTYRGDETGILLHHRNSLPPSPESPLSQCTELDVVITRRNEPGHCLLLMEHYQAYHIHRFMRLPSLSSKKGSPASPSHSLKRVSRGRQSNGADASPPPTARDSQAHWAKLSLLLPDLPRLLDEAGPKLERAAIGGAVTVMAVNAGMAELLANFKCGCEARGVSASSVVVFATDEKAGAAAGALGMEVIAGWGGGMGEVPEGEAGAYGDGTFTDMMFVKVVAVYLPMALGYDVLFQDADVVWHRDPLPMFAPGGGLGDFDAYFMDDGARSLRYAPFSANSGFYYLRNNERTLYLITSLLNAGDSILHTHSHQQTLTTLLTEYNSLYGLSVKVLNTVDFPGGKQYHHEKDYMMSWMTGEVDPVIFHMCWTANKVDKVLYLQQLGEWYLKDTCTDDVVRGDPERVKGCCVKEPVARCHFRDKPSSIRCDDSPNRDQGGKPFWT